MSEPWSAKLTVTLRSPELAGWIERALGPESQREVPRTRTEIVRGRPGSVEVRIEARDSGALRAAANTYLGWVQLALATVASGPPA